MIINYLPQRMDSNLSLDKVDDFVIKINEEVFDFSSLKEGDRVEGSVVPSEFIVGDIKNIDGELYINIILPHGPDPDLCQSFPEVASIEKNGSIKIPCKEEEIENVEA